MGRATGLTYEQRTNRMEAAIVAGKGFTPRQWRRYEKKLAKIMDRPGWRPARTEETPGQMEPELRTPVEGP